MDFSSRNGQAMPKSGLPSRTRRKRQHSWYFADNRCVLLRAQAHQVMKRQSTAWRDGPSDAQIQIRPVDMHAVEVKASLTSTALETIAYEAGSTSVRGTLDVGKTGKVEPASIQQRGSGSRERSCGKRPRLAVSFSRSTAALELPQHDLCETPTSAITLSSGKECRVEHRPQPGGCMAAADDASMATAIPQTVSLWARAGSICATYEEDQ
jgi:hypothetical protein